MAIGQLDYLERAPAGGYTLRFSASDFSWEAVKDTIKGLPRQERYWMARALGGRGCWWVSDAGLAQIKHLFVNYDEMRELADDRARAHNREREQEQERAREYRQHYNDQHRQQTRNVPLSREKAFAELFLLPTAPKEIAQAVHRLLAKKYHPDLGGDLEKMKQINVAWDVVEASYPKENR